MKKKKEKSLKKLTIDEVSNKKQFIRYLEENKALKLSELGKILEDQLNKSYANKLQKDHLYNQLVNYLFDLEKSEENDENRMQFNNGTYERNHQAITSFIHNHVLETKRFPTVADISEDTGLSRTTVYDHLNKGVRHEHSMGVVKSIEYMKVKAMQKLYQIGVQNDDPRALRSFIQLSDKGFIQGNTTINNYIQVNNLKLSQEELKQLPEESLNQIQQIIQEGLKENKTIEI